MGQNKITEGGNRYSWISLGLSARFMREKKGESNDCGWKMAENRRSFADKLVMIGHAKNYDF